MAFKIDGVRAWTKAELSALSSREMEDFRKSIDILGAESGVAQQLNGPITTTDKLMEETALAQCQVLFVCSQGGQAVGFIKTGRKNLFFYTKKGVTRQMEVDCVLDFYVNTSLQRCGIGSLLFREMLKQNNWNAIDLAYDRPSPKLTSFLVKNYSLTNADLQPNRFAIYFDVATK
jgi:alpha-tubulin N-acetyltransferase 1